MSIRSGGRDDYDRSIALTSIPNGDHVSIQVTIPDGEKLRVLSWGVLDDAQNTPANLTIELFNETDGVTVTSENTGYTKEPTGAEVSASGSNVVVSFRINNNTGASINAGGEVRYELG